MKNIFNHSNKKSTASTFDSIEVHNEQPVTAAKKVSKIDIVDSLVVGVPLLAVAVIIPVFHHYDKVQEKRDAELEQGVQESTINDGFNVNKIYWVNEERKDTLLILDLGNCSVDMVRASVELDENGNVTDVSNYTFGQSRFIAPTSVAYEFQDMDTLQENILGDSPCRTLAGAE